MTDIEQQYSVYQREVCEWCAEGFAVSRFKHAHLVIEPQTRLEQVWVDCTAPTFAAYGDQKLKVKEGEIEGWREAYYKERDTIASQAREIGELQAKLKAVTTEASAIMQGEFGMDWADCFNPFFEMLDSATDLLSRTGEPQVTEKGT